MNYPVQTIGSIGACCASCARGGPCASKALLGALGSLGDTQPRSSAAWVGAVLGALALGALAYRARDQRAFVALGAATFGAIVAANLAMRLGPQEET